MNYHCLVVDDEEMIAQSTCEYFNMFDVTSYYVTSYEDCLDFLTDNQVSLILLDINLGSHSGFVLCKSLRQTTSIPILFISARSSDDDILTALNIGGDDYIIKPFSLNILLAKVKAILRRYNEFTADNGGDQVAVNHSPFVLDSNYRQVIINGVCIRLKEMEFKLLDYLMKHSGKVIPKDELLEKVWKDKFIGEGTLSVHIRHLRQKIEKDPDKPKYIKTLWGVGYVFEENGEESADLNE